MQPRKLASRNAAPEHASKTSREVPSARSRAVMMSASWESNPRCHEQGSNLRTRDTPVPRCFTRSMTLATSPKRRKPPGVTRRLSRKLEKTAYICLKSIRMEAGWTTTDAGAHDCPTPPPGVLERRSEQLKYTTAFMTRDECTPRTQFVNENVRARAAPLQSSCRDRRGVTRPMRATASGCCCPDHSYREPARFTGISDSL